MNLIKPTNIHAGLTSSFSDALFTYIERSQVEFGKPFNKLLDAGTGSHSLRWIANLLKDKFNDTPLYVEKYTAVTADEKMRENVLTEVRKLGIEGSGNIVMGNYFSDKDNTNTETGDIKTGDAFLENETFDTILADYLIGAMDGFSPFYQDMMIERLNKHLRPGGRLYIIGLQPIPDKVDGDGNIICKMTKIRDACILLAGHRCYREYPLDWIVRQVQKQDELNVVKISQFPILYSHATIVRQLNVARSKLPLFPSKALAKEMGEIIDKLDKEGYALTKKSPTGSLKLGFDYVVVIEKNSQNT